MFNLFIVFVFYLNIQYELLVYVFVNIQVNDKDFCRKLYFEDLMQLQNFVTSFIFKFGILAVLDKNHEGCPVGGVYI